MLYLEQILNIVDNKPEITYRNGVWVDSRKKHLMDLAGGKPYRYMLQNFFPQLRRAFVEVTYRDVIKQEIEEPEIVVIEEPIKEESKEQIEIVEVVPIYEGSEKRPFYCAVSTNLLYDATLIPNIYAEFYLGRNFSIRGGWVHAWWSNTPPEYRDVHHSTGPNPRFGKDNKFIRLYGGELEVRKWFGRKAKQKPLQGHHVGIGAMIGTYDFEAGGSKKGELSYWSYMVGVNYGYSLPIAKRLNLDFVVGFGYLWGDYKTYVPMDGHYVYQGTMARRYFGPTKAEVSLTYLIRRGH